MIDGVDEEFENAHLGDERRSKRLVKIGTALATNPDATFPDAMGSEAAVEAVYRFLSNPSIEPAAILEPHVNATRRRISGKAVAVVHDSTNFTFDGAAGECLGFIPTTTQRGFVGHFALAVGADGQTLGVLGLETLFFEERIRGVIRRNRSKSVMMYRKRKDKASLRWDRGVAATRALVPEACDAVHVMDAEADNYRLWSAMVTAGDRFVVRVRHRRRPTRSEADAEWNALEDVAKKAVWLCQREVPLSKRRRNPKLNSTHAARDARTATLRIAATSVTIKKPGHGYADSPASLSLNVVRVREIDAPKGTEPVEWLLATTEDVSTQAEVEAVVDTYRRRWRIEEFFRALKTGCAFERRQLESRAAILRTLSLLVPIACRLLVLRDAVRTNAERPAKSLFGATQLAILRRMVNGKLSQKPSVGDALLAVAASGGHLRNNGKPGVHTIARGMEKLIWAEVGYALALKTRPPSSTRRRRSDQ
jgi:hypothetical protein